MKKKKDEEKMRRGKREKSKMKRKDEETMRRGKREKSGKEGEGGYKNCTARGTHTHASHRAHASHAAHASHRAHAAHAGQRAVLGEAPRVERGREVGIVHGRGWEKKGKINSKEGPSAHRVRENKRRMYKYYGVVEHTSFKHGGKQL